MNQNWKDFLIAEHAHFLNDTSIEFIHASENSDNCICALAQFAVLTVSGNDAAQFLQGQTTCNVNDITESRASLGAFCNAKGRTISTFLLVKIKGAFALIMPSVLLEKVRKKLQMYILRADVTLTDSSDQYCLIGLSVSGECSDLDLPKHDLETIGLNGYLVKLPSDVPRYLMIADARTAMDQWSKLTGDAHFQIKNSGHWLYLDILAGVPWLTMETSEEFIPQMLNLDKLGAISFNKGCYTGQEIIARTHYLGKSKRELYLAESDATPAPAPNTNIIDLTGQTAGKVLQAQTAGAGCKMLVVLESEQISSEKLTLDNQAKNPIRILQL